MMHRPVTLWPRINMKPLSEEFERFIFVELSLTNNVTEFNFLQCGLVTKKPDVIINRRSTTV